MSEGWTSLVLLSLAAVLPLVWLYRRQAAQRGGLRLALIWVGIIAVTWLAVELGRRLQLNFT